jgi:poly-gamma-glutamate capsule biosynthesis protein CapA/YwtB (metallophosphatase superfamily)
MEERTAKAARSKSRTVVMVASDWAPIRTFEPLLRSDPEAVYGNLLPVLRGADLRIVNCECALTSSRKPVWKSGAVFKGEPCHAKALSVVPFEVACLANNHVLDYGVPGLRQTLRVLSHNGVRTVGAGLTEEQAHEPLSLAVNKTRLHIVNFSEGEDLTASRRGPGVFGWDIQRAMTIVRRCAKRGGAVIAIGHCGLEYIPYPPPYVAAAFRSLVDAGAACVIGHHPHVPQGVEWYKGRPIAYSLGNFVFYQNTDLHYRKVGFCVSLVFEGNRLSGLDLHPYRITDGGLRALDPSEGAEFSRKVARISRPLVTAAATERAWQAYLAYYGTQGFTGEVLAILEKMKTEAPKGAAMFRNRITTMQHSELWRDFLTRVMAGDRPRYGNEAYRAAEEWFTRKAGEPPR